MLGYEGLSNLISQGQNSDKAVLVLATPGGDAHAGFRIARALQHRYSSFAALVPRYCKSAGTLILVGASELILADRSELGPLDVQIKKSDEVSGRNSGLDYIQAVSNLQSSALDGFKVYLSELTDGMGLSTRIASEISSKLIAGIFQPIFAQIDPMKLAEMQRATEIAYAYGERLNEKSKNLRGDGLQALITAYPSHGFVIDRKEAKKLFTHVSEPKGLLLDLCATFSAVMMPDIDNERPTLHRYQIPLEDEPTGDSNDPSTQPQASARSNEPSEPKIDSGCTNDSGAEPVAGAAPPPVASSSGDTVEAAG